MPCAAKVARLSQLGCLLLGSTVEFDAFELFSSEKRILGCYYGSGQVRSDFPRLVALAEAGRLNLAGAVSQVIALEQINQAFDAMIRGYVIRSVVIPGRSLPDQSPGKAL